MKQPVRTAPASRRRDHGFTLVEILVALGLSLLVALAALALLLGARQGYAGLDAASQLRDNARFATDLITRIALQAGYENVADPGKLTRKSAAITGDIDPDPDIQGYDNAVIGKLTAPGSTSNDSRNAACAIRDTSCRNGSDVLIVQFSGSGTPKGDGSIINCAGFAESEPIVDLSTRSISIFHVRQGGDGEPGLYCTYRKDMRWQRPMPLIRGVESFQVMYGVSGVTPNAAGTVAAMDAAKSAPTRYLHAREMVVAGDDKATRQNWRQVVALRIGLVVRGSPGSAIDRNAVTPLAPLGAEAVTKDTEGKNDSGVSLTPAADGRLRQTVTFTVNLPNWLTLPPAP